MGNAGLDLLAIPITDSNIRAISDVVAYNTDIEVFPFGVPHAKEQSALDYYVCGVERLKKRLEELTGVEITEVKLKEAISLCNRERELLREISLMRKGEALPISSKDFVAINHGSFLADKRFIVEILESVCNEMKNEKAAVGNHPRILLTGSTLAMGDYRILDLIEEAGGSVVIEEFAEGIRPYWTNVDASGNLLKALADSYYMKRVPPAWFRPGNERLDFLIKLARDFNVDGVIWYQLMYRDEYKTESYYFPDQLREETGLRMLTLESDYNPSETAPLRTRIESFIEIIRR